MSTVKGTLKSRFPRDSVLVYIPMSITADMGVAMRRVRSKRVTQLRSLMNRTETSEAEDTAVNKKSEMDDPDKIDESTEKKLKSQSNMDSSIPQREQYSSMLDYLEAKYVRGVMLEEKAQGKGGDKTIDDDAIMSDSEASGSCYSDDSGNFIDDSDLKTDIIQQVVASSSFGTTKLEAEARRSNASNTTGPAEGVIDDDGAYFVNVGDLEMEEGWDDTVLMDGYDGAKRKR